MRAIWMRFRAELRTRWLGMLGVALLIGVAGGAVLASAAGARRTDSTVTRAARSERLSDVLVNPDNSDSSAAFQRAFEQIATRPTVAEASIVNGVLIAPIDASGKPALVQVTNLLALAAGDGRALHTLDRPFIIAGRVPDVARPDEVFVNALAARRLNLRIGSRTHLGIFAQEDFTNPNALPKPRLVRDFTVVGIGKLFDEASRAPDDPNLNPEIVFTPALNRLISGFAPPFLGQEVRLVHGARDVPAFEEQVRALFRDVTIGGKHVNMNFQESALTIARARRAVRPYVLALWMFAGLAALAALAVVGQAVGRSMRPLREEANTLAALGMTRRDLMTFAALRGALIGLLGAAISFVIAVAVSPVMPLGPLRDVDPAPGVDVDGLVLGVGVAIIVLAVAGAAVVAMRRRRGSRSHNTAVVGDQLAKTGASIAVVSGVRFALDRGRDRTVPLPSTLVGITVAIAALVATLVYGAGLTRFTTTPARYGWPWSYQVTADVNSVPPATLASRLAKLPYVATFARGDYSQFDLGGRSVAAVGIDRVPGVPFLPILRGRAPVTNDEIVLGEKTLAQAGAHIASRVRVLAQGRPRDFTVVGTAVFPRLAPYPGSEPTGLGIGAATTEHALLASGANLGSPFFVVQVRPGASVSAAQLKRDAGLGGSEFGAVVGAQRPNDVLSYDRLDRTPLILAAVLVLLALGSAIHLLVTGVRSRRRDVALLKTIGVTGSQARTAVLVQATVLVALALVAALPLGIIGGRWLWMATAHWLGIAADPALPWLQLSAVVIAALVAANLIAFGPASIAARIRPAVALRSE